MEIVHQNHLNMNAYKKAVVSKWNIDVWFRRILIYSTKETFPGTVEVLQDVQYFLKKQIVLLFHHQQNYHYHYQGLIKDRDLSRLAILCNLDTWTWTLYGCCWKRNTALKRLIIFRFFYFLYNKSIPEKDSSVFVYMQSSYNISQGIQSYLFH